MQEFPQVVFLHPGADDAAAAGCDGPDHVARAGGPPQVVLRAVADNLRTLDGNAAFLYGVNLVVATKDLGQFPQIYRDATPRTSGSTRA